MPPADASPAAIAFEDGKRFAVGSLADVAVATKKRLARKGASQVLMFDYASGKVLDLNLDGSEKDIASRYWLVQAQADAEAATPRGPGRPKLGVVAREVTLLPRHWEWLNAQPGGASVALRRLVDDARKASGGRDSKRASQEAAYRFLSAIAGDLPDYEEVLRALFAGDAAGFEALTSSWPGDVSEHARRLASTALGVAK
jgi:hypothetical protein